MQKAKRIGMNIPTNGTWQPRKTKKWHATIGYATLLEDLGAHLIWVFPNDVGPVVTLNGPVATQRRPLLPGNGISSWIMIISN